MGAEVRLDQAGFSIAFRDSWKQALADVEARGGKPYPIPAGASDHPLGGHGFAGWAFELAEQERELGVFFDTIVVCSVTGSTQAGMIAGFAVLEDAGGRPRRVIGIDGSATVPETHAQVARIARRTAAAIGLERDLGSDEIVLDDRYHEGTYGIPGPGDARGDAARRAARGDDHGPGLRGEVDGRADRPRDARGDRGRVERPVRAPRRPARAQRVRVAVHVAGRTR